MLSAGSIQKHYAENRLNQPGQGAADSFGSHSVGTDKTVGAKEILIVDNDERIVELVSWFLIKRGYSVRKAENFTLARKLMREKPVDLLLSDIDLGVESALDELPKLHSEGLLPPTLVFSGYLDGPAKERLIGLGPVVGTLAKPVEFQVLESCVVDYFEGRPLAACQENASSDWLPRGQAPVGGEVKPRISSDVASGQDDWVEIHPPERR